jgi:outer membrane lipoprotein carrier protein
MIRLVSLSLLLLTVAPARAQNANELVGKIQRYYDATKDLHAKFDQVLESTLGGRPKKASGDVWLKKPGKMRWDYEQPEDDKKLMVTDGATLWVYEPDAQQALKQSMKSSTLPAQVSFLIGGAKLADEFDVTVGAAPAGGLGQPGDVVLKLVPKTGTAQYRYLLFAADPKTGAVHATQIIDQQGGTNKLSFSNVEQNKGVPDGKFSFTPPKGTKILSPP